VSEISVDIGALASERGGDRWVLALVKGMPKLAGVSISEISALGLSSFDTLWTHHYLENQRQLRQQLQEKGRVETWVDRTTDDADVGQSS
jgi:hypothetical protein